MTDPPGDATPGAPPDPDEAEHLARRRFFRAFASEAMKTAATVVGTVGALRQSSAEMAGRLIGAAADSASAASSATGSGAGIAPALGLPSSDPRAGAIGYRSPFRVETDTIVVLDQRRLPDEIVEIVCRSGAEVQVALREGAARGAPVQAQLSAAGLALTAERAVAAQPYARRAIIQGTANALRSACAPNVPARLSLERLLAILDARTDLFEDGAALAALFRAEADAMIGEATADHAALARHGAALFPPENPAAGPFRVLTLGSSGALSGGLVGTALAIITRAIADGRSIEVIVCETRPLMTGARLAAWELAQAGVPFEIIPDGAAGALMAEGAVDAVVVAAGALAANGDVISEAGTYPLAALAARHEIPFIVATPALAIDVEMADGAAFHLPAGLSAEVLAFGGRRLGPPGAGARNPGVDITPFGLVGAIVTETGVLRPPYAAQLAAAAALVRGRWSTNAGAPPAPAPAAPTSDPVAPGQASGAAPDAER